MHKTFARDAQQDNCQVTEEEEHVLMPTPTASLETNSEETKINASPANNADSMKLPTHRELDVFQDHWPLVDV